MKYTEFHRRIKAKGVEVRPRRRLALLLHKERQALATSPISWGKGDITAKHSESDEYLTDNEERGAPLSFNEKTI